MNKFEHMEDFVNKLCESLENNPQDFVFNLNTFTMKGSKIVFWSANPSGLICETWNGYEADTVFSEQQGRKIKKSYEIARSKVASEKQKEILKMFDYDSEIVPAARVTTEGLFSETKAFNTKFILSVLLTFSVIFNIIALLEIYK